MINVELAAANSRILDGGDRPWWEVPRGLGLRWLPSIPMARPSSMTPAEFALKWRGSTRSERAAAEEHFIDLCRVLGAQTPNEADPTGETYAFEKGAEKTAGGDGGNPP